jgi:hypothetical protein
MEWISVKDKLPEEKHNCIICLINKIPIACKVHNGTFNLKIGCSFHWPSQKWIKDDFFAEVTHWMPLPDLNE